MSAPYRIDPGPEITAAHPVVEQIVREHRLDVSIKDPFVRPRRHGGFAGGFMDLINDSPKAYSVELVINPHMVCVTHCGRYGLGGGREYFTYVDYPVAPGSPGFAEKLAPLLVEAINTHLARAKAEHDADHAENGPDATYEASEAIVPLGPAGGGE